MTTRRGNASLSMLLPLTLLAAETASGGGVEDHRFDMELRPRGHYTHVGNGVVAVPQFDPSLCGRTIEQIKIQIEYESDVCFDVTNRTEEERIGRIQEVVMVDLAAQGDVLYEGELIRFLSGGSIPPGETVPLCFTTSGTTWRFRGGEDMAPFIGDGDIGFTFDFRMLFSLQDRQGFDVDFRSCDCPIIFSLTVEYTFETSCAADVDDDAVVDLGDLLSVLAAWGECGACAEDVTCDGHVDYDDIVEVLGAWGPC